MESRWNHASGSIQQSVYQRFPFSSDPSTVYCLEPSSLEDCLIIILVRHDCAFFFFMNKKAYRRTRRTVCKKVYLYVMCHSNCMCAPEAMPSLVISTGVMCSSKSLRANRPVWCLWFSISCFTSTAPPSWSLIYRLDPESIPWGAGGWLPACPLSHPIALGNRTHLPCSALYSMQCTSGLLFDGYSIPRQFLVWPLLMVLNSTICFIRFFDYGWVCMSYFCLRNHTQSCAITTVCVIYLYNIRELLALIDFHCKFLSRCAFI